MTTSADTLLDTLNNHRDKLRLFLRDKCRDSGDADAILQELYLKIRSLPQERLQHIDKPEQYLKTMAFNLAMDHLRSLRRQQPVAPSDIEQTEHYQQHQHPGPDISMQDRQTAALLKAALTELPLRTRQAFMLYKLKSFSHKQIASEMGISVSAVEKHIIKAHRHCHQRLQQARP